MAFDLFCASLTTVCELVFPMLLRYITNQGMQDLASITVGMILRIGGIYFALRIVDGLAAFYMAYTGHVMGTRIETDMRQDAFEHLQKLVQLEGRTADDAALRLIARRAEGGLRDAVSLLDQCLVASEGNLSQQTIAGVLGIVDERFVMAMAEAVAGHDGLRIIKGVELLSAEGRDMRLFLQQLLEFVREQLLQNMSGQQTLLTRNQALQMLRDLVDGDQRLRFSLTPRLTLELALLQAAHLEQADN